MPTACTARARLILRLSLSLSLSLGLTSLGLIACGAHSNTAPSDSSVRSFGFELAVDLPGTPQQAWRHFTGDLTPWWDHTFSEQPEALILDARVGGSFYEAFDRQGNGAEHAKVIYAQYPEMIRLDGPLGLSGLGVHMIHEVRFSKREGGTRLDLRVQGLGAVDDELVQTVEGVWRHFLVERFEPYLRAQLEGQDARDEAERQRLLDAAGAIVDPLDATPPPLELDAPGEAEAQAELEAARRELEAEAGR